MIDNNDAATAASTEVTQTPPVEATMTPFDTLQQAKVTELIIKGKSEAAKELRRAHAALLAENEALKKALNLPAETEAALEATNGKLSAATQELARIEGLSKAMQKREALQAAAAAADFFDPSVGATILAGEVTFQNDALVVIDPKSGEPRINAFGQSMTVRELATEKANQHKYMVRSSFKGGVGSTLATSRTEDPFPLEDYFGKNAFGPLAHKLSKSDPRKYAAMRRAAVAKGLLPG